MSALAVRTRRLNTRTRRLRRLNTRTRRLNASALGCSFSGCSRIDGLVIEICIF
jgi:hypothetical protein